MKILARTAAKSPRTRRLELFRLEDRSVPSANPWTDLTAIPASPTGAASYIQPNHDRPFAIDMTELTSELSAAPAEQAVWAGDASGMVFSLPRPDGTTATFSVRNSPIMAPELAAKYPDIQTFDGQGIDDPSATIRMDITPLGFHAQVLSSTSGTWDIDPYYLQENQVYISYFDRDLPASPPVSLDPPDGGDPGSTSGGGPDTAAKGGSGGSGDDGSGPPLGARSGATLRTYRLAVAADGEFTQFYGGTVAKGLAGVVTVVNRVDGVYENEFAIRMVLIANDDQLIYINPANDPYDNTDSNALLDENQQNIDSVIGSANYDIGHVFTTGGGGLAGLGVVGDNTAKAEGETGLSSPIGDDYAIDYVAHEMGHEFGADHTFNTETDSNRSAANAYEPGSGSTIMAYAGIEGAEDLQPHSDPYFHSDSFDAIISYVDTTIPTVGQRTLTGNIEPVANAGADYTIPTSTYFALTATGTDGNGDTLTYDWEERDLGPADLLTDADNGKSPDFRSFNPTTNPTRTFPQLSDVIANTTTLGERMFTQPRTSHFRVTVRDNRAGGGGVSTDDMTLNVVDTGAPFVVTSPNTSGITWNGKSTQTVTWNVAGTTANGINTANVRILLSTDGGLTYPITVLASTPNNGSASITVPNVDTTQGRIRVEAVGNVFFDISDADITVVAIPGITVSPTSGLVTTELGGTAAFSVVLDSPPTDNVTVPISSSNTAEGTVSTSLLTFTPLNWNTPQTVTVTGVADHKVDPDVVYTIVTGTSASNDPKYSGLDPANVSVTNLNEDFATFVFSSTSGLFTTEAGTQATFTVKLATQPTASVTISLQSSNTNEGTVSPSSLTFTTSDWSSPHTVTVTGVDDTAVDGDIAYKIITGAAVTTDSGYSGLNPADVSITNLNDDTKVTVGDLGSKHRYRDLVTVQATVSGLNGHPTTGTVSFSYVDPVSLAVVNLPGTYSVVNGVASISTTLLPIGTDTVNAIFSGDSFYHTSTGSAPVVIGRALLTVTPDALSKVYGAPMPFLSFTAVGYVDNDTAAVFTGSLATTATASSPVGTYLVGTAPLIGTLDASPKYDITIVPNVLFTITKAPLTITALPTPKVYGAAVPVLPIAPPAFVNSDTLSVLSGALSTTATATSVVGTYPIGLGNLFAGGNYTITFVPANLTVTPATVAITPAPKSKQYGPDPVPALTYTSSGFLNINGDSAALLTGALATSANASSIVGQYPITVGTLSAGPNYLLSLPTSVFVTITPAPLTITADSLTSRDGGAIPTLTYTATGFVNGDSASILAGVSLSTPATKDSDAGTYPITLTGGVAPNYTLTRVNGTLTLTLAVTLVGANRFAVGGDAGGTDVVTAYDGSGSTLFSIEPFPGFTGGLRTATGDINGDGVPDLAVGTGPGAATVDLFDGATGNLITSLQPFGDFTGGVFVTLGDMNGDGKAELVVTPDVGGGPRVKIYQGGSLAVIHDFYGIDDTNFRGGARSALGDINGDGYADLVVSAGFGGGPRLSIIDGKQLSQNIFGFLTSDFFAFSNALRNGAFVAVGDVDGDGYADLIVGAGPGGGPQVLVLSGKTLMSQGSIGAMKSPIASFFGGDPNSRNGVFVAARNLDGDSHSDVLVGDGSVATALQGKSLALGNVNELYEIGTDGGPTGGVFVG